jgi:hypothetical protein
MSYWSGEDVAGAFLTIVAEAASVGGSVRGAAAGSEACRRYFDRGAGCFFEVVVFASETNCRRLH